MNERILLQMQYANAIYQAQRFTREAEIAKAQLDALAEVEARAQFTQPARRTGKKLKTVDGAK